MDRPITPEQADFVATKTKELFDYTMQCFDRTRVEGNNVLQWLFGVITGGTAAAGTLHTKGYLPFAMGALVAALAATWIALALIADLRTRQTMPPGNLALSLDELLEEPFPRMKWREARGMDERIRLNIQHTESLATAVDNARRSFALIPIFFVAAVLITYYFE